MENKIVKTLSVLSLALSTSFTFGWDVYEQAKNGNVARLQGTIPAYCPGGAYFDADNLQGALLVVEDYLNAFRVAEDMPPERKMENNNIIYKYCHDENNMAETLDGVFKLYKNVKGMLQTFDSYNTEDSMRLIDLFNASFEWERFMKKTSQKKNLKLLFGWYATGPDRGSGAWRSQARGQQRQLLARIIYDIKGYLSNLELDKNRLQQEGSREFIANYHSTDNLKSRIKDALKLREVVKNGLRKSGYEYE